MVAAKHHIAAIAAGRKIHIENAGAIFTLPDKSADEIDCVAAAYRAGPVYRLGPFESVPTPLCQPPMPNPATFRHRLT